MRGMGTRVILTVIRQLSKKEVRTLALPLCNFCMSIISYDLKGSSRVIREAHAVNGASSGGFDEFYSERVRGSNPRAPQGCKPYRFLHLFKFGLVIFCPACRDGPQGFWGDHLGKCA